MVQKNYLLVPVMDCPQFCSAAWCELLSCSVELIDEPAPASAYENVAFVKPKDC